MGPTVGDFLNTSITSVFGKHVSHTADAEGKSVFLVVEIDPLIMGI